ncbi:tyrosine-type recombinase/integrase [Armatimonas sp.]|uniref:tyrosine-type recombinase/integrase n=1 Tax=Armatimonas sp. TaxID=1872638 RepID=UPI00286B6FF3|nr:tyrosine-type recombinase/integrase [Armatimonas sp.]
MQEEEKETSLSVVAPLVVVQEGQRRDQNAAVVYLASLAPGSRRTMGDALGIIAALLLPELGEKTVQVRIELLPWRALRFQHTSAVRAVLAEKYSYATVNKMLSALRGTIKTAWRLGQLSAEDYQRAVDVQRVQGETLPAGRSLKSGEIAALIDVCQKDRSAVGARDAAIVALLYGCGLRRAELATLSLGDYDAEEGVVKILGKRNKQRLVPVVGGAQAALDAWVLMRGDSPGALLLPSRKGGKLVRDEGASGELLGMTAQALYLILIERAREAGVVHFSPHDFRRTFVGDLLDRGADIATVQKLAGHANVTTTARYDRRGEVAKRKAAELIHVPFRKG